MGRGIPNGYNAWAHGHLSKKSKFMLRRAVKIVAIVACLANAAHAEDATGKKPSEKASALQGLWHGFWGGGEADGVIMQPAMAELFVEGDIVRMRGFPKVGSVDGKLRIDERKNKIAIVPQARAADQPAKALEYTFDLKGDKLTLSRADEAAVTLERKRLDREAFPRIKVDFVAATGIDEAGDLLVTDYTPLEAAEPTAAKYYRPYESKLKTKEATAFLVQKEGLKKISLSEARALLRDPKLVAITYRQDIPEPPVLPSGELFKDSGPIQPDSDAGLKTLARLLRPPLLLFVLSEFENRPQHPQP